MFTGSSCLSGCYSWYYYLHAPRLDYCWGFHRLAKNPSDPSRAHTTGELLAHCWCMTSQGGPTCLAVISACIHEVLAAVQNRLLSAVGHSRKALKPFGKAVLSSSTLEVIFATKVLARGPFCTDCHLKFCVTGGRLSTTWPAGWRMLGSMPTPT